MKPHIERILIPAVMLFGIALSGGCYSNRHPWNVGIFRGTPVWRLAKAVDSQDTTAIGRLIREKGLDPDYQEPEFGYTVLGLAIQRNKELSAKALLDNGADPNGKIGPGNPENFMGESTIMLSAADHTVSKGNPYFLELLLEYGGDPNAQEKWPYPDGGEGRSTAIALAAYGGIEYVRPLVEAGADVNLQTPESLSFGSDALMRTLSLRDLETALYLLHAGADVHTYEVVAGKKQSVLYSLRQMPTYPLDSEEHRKKMEIVDFLYSKGVNYWEYPVPEYIQECIKKQHPDDWEEYMQKY